MPQIPNPEGAGKGFLPAVCGMLWACLDSVFSSGDRAHDHYQLLHNFSLKWERCHRNHKNSSAYLAANAFVSGVSGPQQQSWPTPTQDELLPGPFSLCRAIGVLPMLQWFLISIACRNFKYITSFNP